MRYTTILLALLLLATCAGSGQCLMSTEAFPAGKEMYPVSNKPEMTKEFEKLTALLNLDSRVYGERTFFSEVGTTTRAYYTGGTAAFNEFLQHYVKLNVRPLRLVIHPGSAEVTTQGKETISYDWMLRRYLPGTENMDPSGADEVVVVELYVGGNVELDKLDIPTEIEVGSGGELEKVVSEHRAKRAPKFAIYLLQNPCVSGEDAHKRSLQSLKLQEMPLFTIDDFLYYKWADHSFMLTPDAQKRLPNPPVWGIPFVVVADGHVLYRGHFWTLLSSVTLPSPMICVWPRLDGDVFTIAAACRVDGVGDGSDPRANPLIKEAFEKEGKLR